MFYKIMFSQIISVITDNIYFHRSYQPRFYTAPVPCRNSYIIISQCVIKQNFDLFLEEAIEILVDE